jgi:GTPase SAR1 family protein
MDWNLHNAQQDLQRRQPRNGVRSIGQIKYAPGTVADYGIETAEPAGPVRQFHLTPMSAFRYDHLGTAEQHVLRRAVQKAQGWLDCHKQQPGLSMVLCGPVGVGKTTIAENLMQAFRSETTVSQAAEDEWYTSYLRGAINSLPAGDPRRATIAAMIGQRAPDDAERVAVSKLNGRLFDATELMRLVGDQQPLGFVLTHDQVIVVDDAGTEDFSTPTYTPSAESVQPVRHNRYGRFLEYCYKAGKHVIITSNVPLVAGEEVNPAFIDIFGSKGYSRLLQMAGGYMVDLSGLPDYRPYLAGLLK